MKTWRTLVRVTDVHEEACTIRVCVPGWDPNQTVLIPWHEAPAYLLEVGKRCHARVNIDAEDADELTFTDWEMD